jgi:hypothetical protein
MNYRESSESFRSWFAARRIILDNAYGYAPKVVIEEVERDAVGDALVREIDTGRNIERSLAPDPFVIPHIDADYQQILDGNGAPIDGNSFTDAQFAYMAACLYVALAKLKDAE